MVGAKISYTINLLNYIETIIVFSHKGRRPLSRGVNLADGRRRGKTGFLGCWCMTTEILYTCYRLIPNFNCITLIILPNMSSLFVSLLHIFLFRPAWSTPLSDSKCNWIWEQSMVVEKNEVLPYLKRSYHKFGRILWGFYKDRACQIAFILQKGASILSFTIYTIWNQFSFVLNHQPVTSSSLKVLIMTQQEECYNFLAIVDCSLPNSPKRRYWPGFPARYQPEGGANISNGTICQPLLIKCPQLHCGLVEVSVDMVGHLI
jgi:hypothetical protein